MSFTCAVLSGQELYNQYWYDSKKLMGLNNQESCGVFVYLHSSCNVLKAMLKHDVGKYTQNYSMRFRQFRLRQADIFSSIINCVSAFRIGMGSFAVCWRIVLQHMNKNLFVSFLLKWILISGVAGGVFFLLSTFLCLGGYSYNVRYQMIQDITGKILKE